MFSYITIIGILLCHQALSHYIPSDVSEQSGRIVSGWDAVPGQHPHQAYLRTVGQWGQLISCGGSVIDSNWVLTSATCVANRVSVMVLAGLTRVANAEYISNSNEWYIYPTFNTDIATTAQHNDIALIKLDTSMQFTTNLKSIQLQPSSEAFRDYTNLRLYASGWGMVWTNGPIPTDLQWVFLRGVNNLACRQLFGAIVSDNTICARYYNFISQSICEGDSGGPLVHVNSEDVPVLIGVASFVADRNSGGCHSGHPGGFIRTGPFHAWYEQITGINFDTDTITTTTPSPTTVTYETTTDDSTTTVAETTTTVAETTTTVAETTTTVAETTTTAAETTTTVAETTTTAAETTTTVADSTTTVAETTTTVAETTTTVADSTTTVADSTTTVADSTTTVSDSTTTVADSTTTSDDTTTSAAETTEAS